jgi:protein transport protein SEC24
MPVSGPGALKARDEASVRNTDKEKQLYVPQNDLYRDLAKECVKNAVCVHNYLFPFAYIDVASLSTVSSTTGGDTFFYQQFTPADLDRVMYDVTHVLNRYSGFDAVMRIRCTDGK